MRSKRAFQEDGLLDMVGGITLFAVALINYAAIRSIASMHGTDFHLSRAYQDANSFFIVAILLANVMIMSGMLAIEPLRRRFIYPRMGYVQPRIVPENRRRTILVASVLIGVVHFIGFQYALWGTPGFWTSDMSLVLIGYGIGCGLIVNFRRVGFARHLAVAGIAFVASSLLASAQLGWLHASFLFAMILGTSLIISGATAFADILRVPVATEGDAT
ncbi:MAG: hypothetical protein H8F28_07570 [Fibrella sp.]|nr:hypothetical protein [Armatimonadota bacterium]